MALKKIGKRDAAGLTKGHANSQQSSDQELYQALRNEIDGLRATITALLQKIDADSGDTGGDSDYEATITLADTEFEA